MFKDVGFWKVFITGLVPIVSVIMLAKYQKSPLFFIALFFACLEAGLRQMISSITVCCVHYWKNYPVTLLAVREEIAAKAK